MPRKDVAKRREYDAEYLKGYRQKLNRCVTELRKALRKMPPDKLIAMMAPLDEHEQDLIFTFIGRIRSRGK